MHFAGFFLWVDGGPEDGELGAFEVNESQFFAGNCLFKEDSALLVLQIDLQREWFVLVEHQRSQDVVLDLRAQEQLAVPVSVFVDPFDLLATWSFEVLQLLFCKIADDYEVVFGLDKNDSFVLYFLNEMRNSFEFDLLQLVLEQQLNFLVDGGKLKRNIQDFLPNLNQLHESVLIDVVKLYVVALCGECEYALLAGMANCLLYLESLRELPVLVQLVAALIERNKRSHN